MTAADVSDAMSRPSMVQCMRDRPTHAHEPPSGQAAPAAHRMTELRPPDPVCQGRLGVVVVQGHAACVRGHGAEAITTPGH